MVSISFPKEAALRYASRSPELGQLGIILPAGAILGVGSEDHVLFHVPRTSRLHVPLADQSASPAASRQRRGVRSRGLSI
jgi:hypothetical protein